MITHNRLVSLRNFHEELDRQIANEQVRPYPDAVHLKRLKLRKFAVKQEMESFADQIAGMDIVAA